MILPYIPAESPPKKWRGKAKLLKFPTLVGPAPWPFYYVQVEREADCGSEVIQVSTWRDEDAARCTRCQAGECTYERCVNEDHIGVCYTKTPGTLKTARLPFPTEPIHIREEQPRGASSGPLLSPAPGDEPGASSHQCR